MSTLLAARKVICLDPGSTVAEWVLVESERIAAVGAGEPPSADRVIRTEGVILPGMIDAHVHLTATGLFGTGLDLREARSVPEVLEAVEGFVASASGDWIVGGNFDPGRNQELPTRQELDRVSRGRHLLISRVDGHSCSVNSATLEALQLDPRLPGIELDDVDTPTGILRDRARHEAGARFLSRLPDSEVRRAQEAACRIALARGVTSVHEMAQQARDFEVLMASRSDYPIHVRPYLATFDVGVVIEAGLDCIGGDLFLDGSLGSHTAALTLPYEDKPGSTGTLYHSDEQITSWLVEASRAGVQTAVHAIGDAAIDQALRGMEEAFLRLGPEGALGARRLRHRIEHFEMVSPGQVDRAGRLGIVASVQPMFDRYWGGPDGMYFTRLGKRALGMNPFSRMLKAGLIVAGGSDSTVTPLDPFLGIAAALQHHVEDFAVSIEEALRMFTIWPALAGHQESERGSIEKGKRADLCVVSEDPTVLAPEEIAKIEVIETWVSGNRRGIDTRSLPEGGVGPP